MSENMNQTGEVGSNPQGVQYTSGIVATIDRVVSFILDPLVKIGSMLPGITSILADPIIIIKGNVQMAFSLIDKHLAELGGRGGATDGGGIFSSITNLIPNACGGVAEKTTGLPLGGMLDTFNKLKGGLGGMMSQGGGQPQQQTTTQPMASSAEAKAKVEALEKLLKEKNVL